MWKQPGNAVDLVQDDTTLETQEEFAGIGPGVFELVRVLQVDMLVIREGGSGQGGLARPRRTGERQQGGFLSTRLQGRLQCPLIFHRKSGRFWEVVMVVLGVVDGFA